MKETDPLSTLFVCTPEIESLCIGNADPHTFLYRSEVDPEKVLCEHSGLVRTVMDVLPSSINVVNFFHRFDEVDATVEEKTNMVFVRDTFVCVGKGVVMCRMKEPVRTKEVKWIEHLLQTYKIPIWGHIEKGVLEGGDVFLAGDTCFIGIGPRSNLEGVQEWMQKKLYPWKRICVVRPLQEDTNMHRIHLDCIFSLLSEHTCVLWEELLDTTPHPYTRVVDEYIPDDEYGRWYKNREGIPFGSYLQELHYNIIPISTTSQQNYGCNTLCLGNGKILVQDKESHEKINGSIYVPFQEIHKMYGGIHCATNALR